MAPIPLSSATPTSGAATTGGSLPMPAPPSGRGPSSAAATCIPTAPTATRERSAGGCALLGPAGSKRWSRRLILHVAGQRGDPAAAAPSSRDRGFLGGRLVDQRHPGREKLVLRLL